MTQTTLSGEEEHPLHHQPGGRPGHAWSTRVYFTGVDIPATTVTRVEVPARRFIVGRQILNAASVKFSLKNVLFQI
jgi:hypothetical protein